MVHELRVPELEKTGKYIGIPPNWDQTKKQMSAWILARVNMKLEGWNEKVMSKAGRETLINVVAGTLLQYTMSIFKVPISIFRVIEKKIETFW